VNYVCRLAPNKLFVCLPSVGSVGMQVDGIQFGAAWISPLIPGWQYSSKSRTNADLCKRKLLTLAKCSHYVLLFDAIKNSKSSRFELLVRGLICMNQFWVHLTHSHIFWVTSLNVIYPLRFVSIYAIVTIWLYTYTYHNFGFFGSSIGNCVFFKVQVLFV